MRDCMSNNLMYVYVINYIYWFRLQTRNYDVYLLVGMQSNFTTLEIHSNLYIPTSFKNESLYLLEMACFVSFKNE